MKDTRVVRLSRRSAVVGLVGAGISVSSCSRSGASPSKVTVRAFGPVLSREWLPRAGRLPSSTSAFATMTSQVAFGRASALGHVDVHLAMDDSASSSGVLSSPNEILEAMNERESSIVELASGAERQRRQLIQDGLIDCAAVEPWAGFLVKVVGTIVRQSPGSRVLLDLGGPRLAATVSGRRLALHEISMPTVPMALDYQVLARVRAWTGTIAARIAEASISANATCQFEYVCDGHAISVSPNREGGGGVFEVDNVR